MMLFNDEDILARAVPRAIIEALRLAYLDPPPTSQRLQLPLPGGDEATLLVMPSWSGRDWIGVKTATVFPSNPAQGLPTVGGAYALLDGRTGGMHAVLSAPALTLVRTAAVSALAASFLARDDAKTLLVIGTGALAPHLARYHRAVRPICETLVWGRNRDRAERLARALDGPAGSARAVTDLGDALVRADVVTAATSSSHPLIDGGRVRPGAHVDLVGSFTPAMREADSALFGRGRLVVDTDLAFHESGDLLVPVGEGVISGEAPDLAGLVASPALRRRDPAEITIFKAVGSGFSDLAVAVHLVGAPWRPLREPASNQNPKLCPLDFG